jgi:hypothetical protein
MENYQYLFAKNPENEGVFLIWNGNSKSQLTQENYYQIVQEAQQANLSSEKYIIYARLCKVLSSVSWLYNLTSDGGGGGDRGGSGGGIGLLTPGGGSGGGGVVKVLQD